MRPDEEAAQTHIEQDEKFRSGIKRGVGTAFGLGAAGASTAIGSKIMPFLSQYVPADLAMKGINKVAPSIGNFLKRGQSMGLDIEEGLQFVRDSFSPKENAKDNKNIIQMYSPELHEFIVGEIQQGRSPLEAGALASLDRKGKDFKKIIKQIEKDHKAPFSAILETAYGGQGAAKQAPDPGQQPAGQSGQGQAALMAILQKIQQARGAQ